MVADRYIIYSLRSQGWVFKGAGYGTDRKEAREFGYTEALDYCRRAMPNEGGSQLLMVDAAAMNEIEKK